MQAHIVRIETGNTRAWQVRYNLAEVATREYHSKAFYDSRCGGRKKARKAAEEYLADVLSRAGATLTSTGRRIGLKYPENPQRVQRHNLSGRNGVYRSEFVTRRARGEQEVRYWAASYTIGPDGQKTNRSRRFYIGERSEEDARRLATEFREGWEHAFLTGGNVGVKKFFRQWDARRRKLERSV